ncbi:MAG TPA: hypothetical protein VNA14_06915 [Mycobacteriales bacterium]|nr:hypothetical protein [Mycobacteriales bacterium]
MTRSATATAARPRTAARPATPARRAAPVRPPLVLVPPSPWRPARAPFVLLSLVVVLLGLLGLLVLNTVLAQDSFRRHDLERELALLSEREAALSRDVAALESPERLAQVATQMGLVPAGAPAFIRLSDGALVGVPSVATAAPVTPAPVGSAAPKPAGKPAGSVAPKPAASRGTAPTVKPSAKPSAKPTAKPAASPAPRASTRPSTQPSSRPGAAPSVTP